MSLLPLRGWLYLAAALSLFGGYAYWTHHQRVIGRANCEAAQVEKQAKIESLQTALQQRVDADAERDNAQLRANYETLNNSLPGYLRIYGDKSPPSDCTSFMYMRKAKP